jgi:hypothetical protein
MENIEQEIRNIKCDYFTKNLDYLVERYKKEYKKVGVAPGTNQERLFNFGVIQHLKKAAKAPNYEADIDSVIGQGSMSRYEGNFAGLLMIHALNRRKEDEKRDLEKAKERKEHIDWIEKAFDLPESIAAMCVDKANYPIRDTFLAQFAADVIKEWCGILSSK